MIEKIVNEVRTCLGARRLIYVHQLIYCYFAFRTRIGCMQSHPYAPQSLTRACVPVCLCAGVFVLLFLHLLPGLAALVWNRHRKESFRRRLCFH